jgi:hypothetical protein
MPRKRLVFSSPASLVSKDDGQLAVVDEIAEGSGMGVRGKGLECTLRLRHGVKGLVAVR